MSGTHSVLRRPLESALNAAIGMVDQAGIWPLRRDCHPQRRQRQLGAQMIRHRPADDLAAVEVHDRGQIEPALISLDIGDVGEPDVVRRGGDEVALEQVRRDREIVTAVGDAHPSRPRHDGSDTVTTHQPLDATTARSTALGLSARHGCAGCRSGRLCRDAPA